MLRLPPPIWVLVYVVVAVVISYLLGWPRVTGLPIIWLGVALIVAGIAVMTPAVMLFRREGADLNPNATVNRKLVTTGPYSFTRNPMYLGWLITTLGLVCLIGTIPMLLVPIAFFATITWTQIPAEEASMRRQFGAAFDDYTRRVRRWI